MAGLDGMITIQFSPKDRELLVNLASALERIETKPGKAGKKEKVEKHDDATFGEDDDASEDDSELAESVDDADQEEEEDSEDSEDSEEEDESKKASKGSPTGKQKQGLAQVVEALRLHAKSHSRAETGAILKKFKVKNPQDLDPSQYPKILKALR